MLRRLPGLLFWPLTLGLVVGLACLLAGPIHELLAGFGWLRPDDRDFLRVFRRLLLVPLVAVFLWRMRPWRDGLAEPYGLRRPRARWAPPLIGFALTVAVLLLVLAWQFQQGWLRFESSLRWGEFARRLAIYLPGGILIGLLEEWFFRGWLTARAKADLGPRMGVLLAAGLFAVVHAFRPSKIDHPVSHDAAGAYGALQTWLGHAADPAVFGPAGFGLLCFALLLTAAYARTGTLWTAVGIHAGAVLVIMCDGALTERVVEQTWAGSDLLYDGPVVWAIALLGAAWLGRARPETSAPETAAEGSGA